jgi:hypothetical protein
MAKKTKKESVPRPKSAPMLYSIAKAGFSVEEASAALIAAINEDPNWFVTKTEVSKLKFVRERDPRRARIVGTLQVVLKCR